MWSLQTGAEGPLEEDSGGPRLGQGLSPSFREQAGGQATHISSALWEALVSVHRAWTFTMNLTAWGPS